MGTFDLKKFLINEGMTRVSRDRERLLKEDLEINQKGYQLAKDILSGKVNGFVALLGDWGHDVDMLPAGKWDQDMWDKHVWDTGLRDEMPTSDGIWAVTYNPNQLHSIFLYDPQSNDDPEVELYKVWEELKRFAKDYQNSSEYGERGEDDWEEIREGDKVIIKNGKVISINGEAPDHNEETPYMEAILSVEELNIEDGLYYVIYYDDAYMISRDPDIVTSGEDEYWGEQDYYWYKEDSNLSESEHQTTGPKSGYVHQGRINKDRSKSNARTKRTGTKTYGRAKEGGLSDYEWQEHNKTAKSWVVGKDGKGRWVNPKEMGGKY